MSNKSPSIQKHSPKSMPLENEEQAVWADTKTSVNSKRGGEVSMLTTQTTLGMLGPTAAGTYHYPSKVREHPWSPRQLHTGKHSTRKGCDPMNTEKTCRILSYTLSEKEIRKVSHSNSFSKAPRTTPNQRGEWPLQWDFKKLKTDIKEEVRPGEDFPCS